MFCPNCKGNKALCFKEVCPYENKQMFKSVDIMADEFSSNSPPSVFVGSKLPYPHVNVGVLSPPQRTEDSWMYDAQTFWARENIPINQILKYRSQLINSRFKTNVLSARTSTKFLDLTQEIGMALKPVDVEIELAKKIHLGMDYDNVALPTGPKALLKKLTITENVKIDRKVEKIVDDTDLKAAEGLEYLYQNKFDEKALHQLLSIGVLGLVKNRKLVPTRWAITAVDDVIGKNLLKAIRYYNSIDSYMMYYGHYLGNHFIAMLFPDVFSYEVFENYLPRSSWNPGNEVKTSTDYENFYGRKNYVEETAGGYYAGRLPVLETLNAMRRQATCLVLRFETPDYWASLGVFVVREAMRKTMRTQPMIFDSKEAMLKKARDIALSSVKFDINGLLKRSKVLATIKTQTKLLQFI